MSLKFTPVYLFDENDNAFLFEEEKPLAEHPAYSAKDINIVDSQGRTSLMKAAAENNIILMHQLIHSGADVNAQDNDGWTAAMFSIRYGGTDLPLRMLQESGANLKHKNKFGISALQIASGKVLAIIGATIPATTDKTASFTHNFKKWNTICFITCKFNFLQRMHNEL